LRFPFAGAFHALQHDPDHNDRKNHGYQADKVGKARDAETLFHGVRQRPNFNPVPAVADSDPAILPQ